MQSNEKNTQGCPAAATAQLRGFMSLARQYVSAAEDEVKRMLGLPVRLRRRAWAARGTASPRHWFGPYSTARLRYVARVLVESRKRLHEGFVFAGKRRAMRIKCLSGVGTRCERRPHLLANASQYGTIRVCPRLLKKPVADGATTILHESLHRLAKVDDQRASECRVGKENRCYGDGALALVRAGKFAKALQNNDNYAGFARAVFESRTQRRNHPGGGSNMRHGIHGQGRIGDALGSMSAEDRGGCSCKGGCGSEGAYEATDEALEAGDFGAEDDEALDHEAMDFDDEALDDEALDDEALDDEALDDEAMDFDDEALDDEALDDEALDDETLDFDDEALDDEALDDEALDDEALDDEALDCDAEDFDDEALDDEALDDDDEALDDEALDAEDLDDEALTAEALDEAFDDEALDAGALNDEAWDAEAQDDEALDDEDLDDADSSHDYVVTKRPRQSRFIKKITWRNGRASPFPADIWTQANEDFLCQAVNTAQAWLSRVVDSIDFIHRTKRWSMRKQRWRQLSFGHWFGTRALTARQMFLTLRRIHTMARFFRNGLRIVVHAQQKGARSGNCNRNAARGTQNRAYSAAPVLHICPAFFQFIRTDPSGTRATRTIIHELTHRLLQPGAGAMALGAYGDPALGFSLYFGHPKISIRSTDANGRRVTRTRAVRSNCALAGARFLALARPLAARRSPVNWGLLFQEIGTTVRPTAGNSGC